MTGRRRRNLQLSSKCRVLHTNPARGGAADNSGANVRPSVISYV